MLTLLTWDEFINAASPFRRAIYGVSKCHAGAATADRFIPIEELSSWNAGGIRPAGHVIVIHSRGDGMEIIRCTINVIAISHLPHQIQ